MLAIVLIYFVALLVIAYYASKGANNESFFIGKKNSSWLLVAYGMIGTSLSGVTFMSVPGGVNAGHFGYLQVVIGYLIGYMVVAFVLLPLYYKMNLTSIYSYLENRFGIVAYKTGASFFILSRTLGATIRIYLVIKTLQFIMLDSFGIPFALTVFVILLMILLYTYKGGVKTIVITDTLQTTFMLLALVVTIGVIMSQLNFSMNDVVSSLQSKGYSQVFHYDWKAKNYFLKHILGGMFITIAMTGLDQEMMQKNISVKTIKDSQKNMISFSLVLVVVNFLFLFLGGILYLYAEQTNLKVAPDDLFPTVALGSQFSGAIGIIFIIALISALFPSVDGAITSITSCFCIDILGMNKQSSSDLEKKRTRLKVHFTFAFVFFIMVLIFKAINDKLIIDFILKFAGITYGPLLGLFSFGILTKRNLNDKFVWLVCISAPLIALLIDVLCSPEWYEKKLHIQLQLTDLSQNLFSGYKIGQELILINGIITFAGLWLISNSKSEKISVVN